MDITDILYNFKILPKNSGITESKIISPVQTAEEVEGIIEAIKINTYAFPETMDITEWGEVKFNKNYTEAKVYKPKSKGVYCIKINKSSLDVDFVLHDKIFLSFKDELSSDKNDLNTFVRTFKNYTYNIVNGKVLLKRKTVVVSKLKPIKEQISFKDNFLTMDIETRRIGKDMVPYTICI
jgi:hypothetical protein